MKRLFLTIICGIAIFIILVSPELITDGVRQGIELSLYSVIPSLLPFMVLTNIMLKYNLCEYISYLFNPLLSKIFRISSNGCFAIIIGFTCGYPMGAKIVGDLYNNNLISKSEAGYLITFCNNCSITFLLNYVLFNCLGSDMPLHTVVLLVYLPPVIAGVINKFLLKPDIKVIKNIKNIKYKNSSFKNTIQNPIFNAIKSISVLSVYVICFTVISKWIASSSSMPRIVKCVIAGFTEITSGADFIAASISNINMRNYLILAFTVFGGLSIAFQSFEQLPNATLKRNYILGKMEQLLIFNIIFLCCV